MTKPNLQTLMVDNCVARSAFTYHVKFLSLTRFQMLKHSKALVLDFGGVVTRTLYHPRVALFAVPSIQLGNIRSAHSWTVGKKLAIYCFCLTKQLTLIEPPSLAVIIFVRETTYRSCIPRFVHRLQYLVRRSIHLRLPPNLSYIGWIGRWSSGGSWADHRR